MRIIVVLLALLIVASLSSCKEKKKEVLTVQKVEVVEVVEPVAPPEPEPVVKQENYYLVAGCFEVSSNAESLNTQLLSEGYNSKVIPFYNMSMVTYDGFETRQEAQEALNQIVSDPKKEWTWVYPVK